MSNFTTEHELPEDDWIEHEESMDCVCGPYVARATSNSVTVRHHSLDNREGHVVIEPELT